MIPVLYVPLSSRKSAEELIEMTPGSVRNPNKTGDEGSLEGKVNDLLEMEIVIIANASYDEYNEEIRLNAAKYWKRKFN